MKVMIGVDPHKGSPTATMLDRHEHELLAWADGVKPRTWAVESADGMGYLLAHQLVAAGESVVNVPAMLASRVRVLASAGRPRTIRTMPARSLSPHYGLRRWHRSSVPITPRCAGCWSGPHDLARWRNKLCCRLHALVADIDRLDGQLRDSRTRITTAVAASAKHRCET